MKKLLLALSKHCFIHIHAQKNINALINAEKAFASYAIQHGIKQAFLNYLDSNYFVLKDGNTMNGIQYWKTEEDIPGILNWFPQYAEIAESGDLGYTCSPFTFQDGQITDSIMLRGRLHSIWKMNKKGEWKKIVDLGTDVLEGYSINHKSEIIAPANKRKGGSIKEMLDAENKFIKGCLENTQRVCKNYLSEKALLSRRAKKIAIDPLDQENILENQPPTLQLKVLGYGISLAGDLGYVYGASEKKKGQNVNYLHVWRKENHGWKIALDALQE